MGRTCPALFGTDAVSVSNSEHHALDAGKLERVEKKATKNTKFRKLHPWGKVTKNWTILGLRKEG